MTFEEANAALAVVNAAKDAYEDALATAWAALDAAEVAWEANADKATKDAAEAVVKAAFAETDAAWAVYAKAKAKLIADLDK